MTRFATVVAMTMVDDEPEDIGSGDAEESSSREPGVATGTGKRVLIVEDDYFVALTIEDTLVGAGYSVIGPVTTAAEAIEVGLRERPHLVLMDITLAGESDGIAAAVALSASGIRSLFVTAHSDPQTRHRGEAAAPAGWLDKPFQPTRLLCAVSAALEKG